MKFEILSLDVWGNKKDGFELNAWYSSGIVIDVTETDTQATVLKKAKKALGIVWKGQYVCSEFDEYHINFDIKSTGKPAIYMSAIKG